MSELFRSRDTSSGRAAAQSLRAGPTSTSKSGQESLQRATLHKSRHGGLFEAVNRLDAQIDEASRRELASWIVDQYATEYGDIPLGFLARCYLGPPYVDHRLDLMAQIVEHFQPGDAVPTPFDRARPLARLSSYQFIEVYGSGTLVPVRADGSVDAPIGGPNG